MIKTEQQPYQSAEEMGEGLQTAVLRWILSVADTKHRIGMQNSHWVTGTPALEAAVGSAAITQDELGHARSLYGLLRTYPGAPEGVGAENDLEARDVYYAPADLMPRWESWLKVVAINVVLDAALQVAIAQTKGSTFSPLAGRTAKILQEERFHRIFGQSWLERLAGHGEATKAQLQQQIDWAWRITDAWLGPDDDAVTGELVVAGVLREGTAVMRQQWLAEVEPLLAANGLTRPEPLTDWSSWDAQFRQNNDA
ncbi:MAG: Phenylacetic acid catabolic protein [Chloroflexota bacterium]